MPGISPARDIRGTGPRGAQRLHLGHAQDHPSRTPRPGAKAADVGFTFRPYAWRAYWDETTAYQFTLAQIEDDLEGPATELHAMVRQAVDRIVADPALMTRLASRRRITR